MKKYKGLNVAGEVIVGDKVAYQDFNTIICPIIDGVVIEPLTLKSITDKKTLDGEALYTKDIVTFGLTKGLFDDVVYKGNNIELIEGTYKAKLMFNPINGYVLEADGFTVRCLDAIELSKIEA